MGVTPFVERVKKHGINEQLELLRLHMASEILTYQFL